MLNIDMEFKKGVLFVRLNGILDEKTVDKLNDEVTELIRDNGVNNIVFNIEGLSTIDSYGINALLKNYELCHKERGQTLLCGIENPLVKYRLNNSRILKYMYETSDELTAIDIINPKENLWKN